MTSNVLKELMFKKGVTQVQLAKDIGVSRQSIGRWLKGHPIDDKNLKLLSEYFNISEQTLLYGDSINYVSVYEKGDIPPEDVVVIKEYRLVFGAHADGIEPTPEWEIVEGGDEYWYKLAFFQHRHLNPERCRRARVYGDSMEPTICDGDMFLFNEEIDKRPCCVLVADGKVYAISVDGKLKIKRLSTSKDGIIVRSDNPAYKDEIFTGDDLERLRIHGRVIEVSRSF